MMLPPREPQPGDKITANWARDVVRYMRAITPLPGPGTRIDRKPHGSIIHGGGCGGGGGGGSSVNNGCFKIQQIQNTTVSFENCYYMIGGKFYEITPPPAITVSASLNVAVLKISTEGSGVPSAYVIPTSIEAIKTDDPSSYRLPLYIFDVEGTSCSVKVDMRNIPSASMYEF